MPLSKRIKEPDFPKLKMHIWRLGGVRSDIEKINAPEEVKLQVLGRFDDFLKTYEKFIQQLEQKAKTNPKLTATKITML